MKNQELSQFDVLILFLLVLDTEVTHIKMYVESIFKNSFEIKV